MQFDDFDNDTQRQIVRLVMIDWARQDLYERGQDIQDTHAVLLAVARLLVKLYGCPAHELDDAANIVARMTLMLAHKRTGKPDAEQAVWALTNAILDQLDEPHNAPLKRIAYQGGRHAIETGIVQAEWLEYDEATVH